MKKDELKYFKNKLTEEKKDILKSIESKIKEGPKGTNIRNDELSKYDNHPGERATEVFLMEQSLQFEESLKKALNEINKSLEDIETGGYGICEVCEKDIEKERLESIPYVKTCAEHAKKDPQIENEEYESIDGEDLDTFASDSDDSTGYDKEDTYQDMYEDNIVPKDPSLSTGDNIDIMDEEESDVTGEVEEISDEYYEDTQE